MDTRIDFLQMLDTDMSLNILMCLADPSDIIHASAVSRFWRRFVIANGLSKQLCLRMFPQVSSVARVIEPSCRMKQSVDVGSSNSMEWKALERDHRIYASLFQALKSFSVCDCLADAISASSTDNYPEESIVNTLDPRDVPLWRASYWSSKGHSDPAVPETLTYKLRANLCIITEISIHPFQAYFQSGLPIYSAKSVRFRVGHPKFPSDIESDLMQLPLQHPADDKFIWTYTSQEFPMAQENCLQKFKLLEPVLCIGGILQIELLDRVQRQEMDGLFYICVSHVQVLGRSLSPAFDVENLEPSGKFLLKYYPEAFHRILQSTSDGENHIVSSAPSVPREEMLWGHFEGLVEYLMRGNEPGAEPFEWEEDNELDELLIF